MTCVHITQYVHICLMLYDTYIYIYGSTSCRMCYICTQVAPTGVAKWGPKCI